MDPNQSLYLQLALAQQQILRHDSLMQNRNNILSSTVSQTPAVEVNHIAHNTVQSVPPSVQQNGFTVGLSQAGLPTLLPRQFNFPPNPIQNNINNSDSNLKRSNPVILEETNFQPKRPVPFTTGFQANPGNLVDIQLAQPVGNTSTNLLPSPPSLGVTTMANSPVSVQIPNFNVAQNLPPILSPVGVVNSPAQIAMPNLGSFNGNTNFPELGNCMNQAQPVASSTETSEDKNTPEFVMTPAVFKTIQSVVDQRDAQRKKFKAEIVEKDKTIAELREELARKNKEIEAKDKRNEQLNEILTEKIREVAMMQGEIIRYKSLLAVSIKEHNQRNNFGNVPRRSLGRP